MHICCTNMLRMGKYRLPKLFMVSGYTVCFWSNENGEPICAKWKQAFLTDEIKFLLLKDTAIVYRENISVPCRCFVL